MPPQSRGCQDGETQHRQFSSQVATLMFWQKSILKRALHTVLQHDFAILRKYAATPYQALTRALKVNLMPAP